jgi:hypothetical protein
VPAETPAPKRRGACPTCGNPADRPAAKPPHPPTVHKLLTLLFEQAFEVDQAEAAARALTFMRMAPGCVVRTPDMAAAEKYIAEERAIARWKRDASPEAVAHACDVLGLDRKEASKVLKARNNGMGLAALRAHQSALLRGAARTST